MVARYPALVEAVIEFKLESKRILALYNNKEFKETPEMKSVDIAHNYRIEYSPHDNFHYCLFKD